MIDPSGERHVHHVQQRHADGLGRVAHRRLRRAPAGAGRPVDHRRAGRRGAGGARRRPDASVRPPPCRATGPTSAPERPRSPPRSSTHGRGRSSTRSRSGTTLEETYIGASVAVSPDRGLIAVSSGLAVTVLDARSREPVRTFTVPASGYPGPDGQPLPVGVVGCLAWTADGSRLLLGVQGGGPRHVAARRNPARRRHGELGDRRRSDGGRRAGGDRAQPGRPERGAGGRVDHRTGDPGHGHAGRARHRGTGPEDRLADLSWSADGGRAARRRRGRWAAGRRHGHVAGQRAAVRLGRRAPADRVAARRAHRGPHRRRHHGPAVRRRPVGRRGSGSRRRSGTW